jgi:hypothetical protein
MARSAGSLRLLEERASALSRWAKSGVFDRIFRLLASDADNEYMMIDATIVRAHQHSAGAQKKAVTKRLVDRAAEALSFSRSRSGRVFTGVARITASSALAPTSKCDEVLALIERRTVELERS